MKRKLITLTDGLIIAAVILVCTAAVFIVRQGDNSRLTAEITSENGVEIIELWKVTEGFEKEIISCGHSLILSVEHNSICIRDSSCKDGVCVNTGVLDSKGDSAVCLPARVTVRVLGGSEEQEVDVIL